MATIVFLDCEFTHLINVQLLSLGMVCLDDETRELYVELDMASDIGKARRKASSEFVKYGRNVSMTVRHPGTLI